MTTVEQDLTFVDGIASQPDGLERAHAHIRDWLAGTNARPLRDARSVLLTGIGASFCATATPTYELLSRGQAAYRIQTGELPAATAAALSDQVVAVSQSGRSVEAVRLLQSVPTGRRVALVNDADSPLAQLADTVLSLGGLPDSTMSSVAFSATLLALGMLADQLGTGAIDPGWHNLPAHAAMLLDDPIDAVARFLDAANDAPVFDIVGSAASLSAAEQGSLLLREGPLVPACAMETRAYLHGQMDSAGCSAHIVIGREREAQLAEQLLEKEVPVLLITDRPPAASGAFVQQLPSLPASQRAVLETIVMQRIVLGISQRRGVDIEGRAFTRIDTKVESIAQANDAQL